MMLIATLRTAVFYLFVVPFTFAWAAVFGLFAFLIPYPLRNKIVIGGWARVLHFLTVFILGIRCNVHGRENIPKQAGVIISNHQSAWETYYLQILFAPQSQVAKSSLLKIPIFGWTFSLMRPISINRAYRRQAMSQVIEQGSQRIAEGSFVLIFPEGTRARPGFPLPFRKGGVLLAKEAQCHVIPVTHNGGEYWLNDRFAKLPGTIDIYIHPSVNSVDKAADALLAEVETTITSKLDEITNKTGYTSQLEVANRS
ncbi:lysophospholipid acyltransferase family protein [Reinekea sp.]|jgi:1-acyl-sn-glycerol-3-phosphate acyltransferase|uniref:lysophospholipid acyltransferase family protein n=1 Tax=Reinekea sp. TaxID=1970455 RepID=UPI0039893D51